MAYFVGVFPAFEQGLRDQRGERRLIRAFENGDRLLAGDGGQILLHLIRVVVAGVGVVVVADDINVRIVHGEGVDFLIGSINNQLKSISEESFVDTSTNPTKPDLEAKLAIVVHIMQPAVRSYYNLEELWAATPARPRRAA